MKRIIQLHILLALAVFCLGVSDCSGGRPSYVGYGYYNHTYYDDVFYTAPIDRYGYGFYGHP